MKYRTPNHFSYNYELNIENLPAKKSDRLSFRILIPGLIFAVALIVLGLYEMFNGFDHAYSMFDSIAMQPDSETYRTFITPTFFDLAIIIIGLGTIVSLVLSYIRYKKVIFDGKNISVTYRPCFGPKKIFKEKLSNYQGIGYRIEFFQCGFWNRNKYIIELLHKDVNKSIPLYISTNDNNIRKIWEYYARQLNMPTICTTDEGVVVKNVKDLDKSIKEMAEIWHLNKDYDPTAPVPPSIAYTVKNDKIIVKGRKIVWDAFNFLAWIFIFVFLTIFVIASINFTAFKNALSIPAISVLYFVGFAGLLFSVFTLFRKDKIVIKPDKIIHVHKFMLFSRKNDEMKKADIEAIDVTVNPATGRYFVAIYSDNKTIIFGKKLPIEELRWVKKFLIHEIIK